MKWEKLNCVLGDIGSQEGEERDKGERNKKEARTWINSHTVYAHTHSQTCAHILSLLHTYTTTNLLSPSLTFSGHGPLSLPLFFVLKPRWPSATAHAAGGSRMGSNRVSPWREGHCGVSAGLYFSHLSQKVRAAGDLRECTVCVLIFQMRTPRLMFPC